jgi:hypothetical protein
MNFGEQYLASNFVKSNEDHPLSKVKVPLTVGLCEHCGLLQLGESVNRDLLFRDYFYRSGTNPMMRAALKDVVEDVTRNIDLREGDYILDIGCNDCTMLSLFSDRYRRIGIDPAQNVNRSNLDESITVVSDFFSKKAVMEMTGDSPCRVVTSIAMLYGVEDLNAFASEVESILAPDGVWCIQLSYLPEIINNLSFYDVCHEHLYYFSLHTLNELMERNGLAIFDASVNDVNGGSLRVFATRRENPRKKTEGYHRVLGAEEKMRLSDKKTYEDFFEQVCELKKVITNYIRCETERGAQIIGLGASTKGNVLLQFFDIDRQHLPYISERNPEKVALRTLGTDIEIISEEKARELNPDAMLVLIWFFKDEVIRREREYLDRGGKLLFPMPYCHIVTGEGEQRL